MYFTIFVLLFIYCCKINYNKLCSWKQHVRSLAWYCWVLCWGYHMTKIKMLVKLSSPGSSKKKFSFKLILVIFKIQFTAVIGLSEILCPFWLSSGGCRQLLETIHIPCHVVIHLQICNSVLKPSYSLEL